MRTSFFIAFVFSTLLVPSFASAQENRVEARYAEAIEAFKAERFEEAAAAFLDVHAMAPAAVLLYNAAYAFGRAGRYERAVEEAERAAALGFDEPERAIKNEARSLGWSSLLHARESAKAIGKAAESRPVARVRDEPEVIRDDDGASVLPWISGGLTAAAAGLLVGAFLVSSSVDEDAGELESLRNSERARYDAALEDIEGRQTTGQILLISGAVALTGAAVLWTWWLLDSDTGTEVGIRFSPTGVSAAGRF